MKKNNPLTNHKIIVLPVDDAFHVLLVDEQPISNGVHQKVIKTMGICSTEDKAQAVLAELDGDRSLFEYLEHTNEGSPDPISHDLGYWADREVFTGQNLLDYLDGCEEDQLLLDHG